jgi:hypothetical protein
MFYDIYIGCMKSTNQSNTVPCLKINSEGVQRGIARHSGS